MTIREVFEAPLSLTEGEAYVLLAALRYTDAHSTINTSTSRDLIVMVERFIDHNWPRPKE